jgi:hypothetical protein
MPQFDSTTLTKLASLRAAHPNGSGIEVEELVQTDWPSPDGTIYYASTQVDEISSVPPSVSPIETRLIPSGDPNWFLPVTLGATIGDESVDLSFNDLDGAMSDLINTHGEGIKVTLYYWFPEVELLLPLWFGHLQSGDDAEVDVIKLKAVQGFRSQDVDVPGRRHYQQCQAIFGGLLPTQAQIDEGDCPYNKHLGGGVGNNDPSTSQPWTFCDRRDLSSCTARSINPLFHLSHKTIESVVLNQQTHGGNLYSTSHGNETSLEDPVRVVMGWRRIYDMKVMAFRRDLNNNHPDQGFFFAYYEGCEGPLPVDVFTNVIITVGGTPQQAVGLHYGYRRGLRGDLQTPGPLSTHGYSGTGFISYNYGWVNPADIQPGDASAAAFVNGGLSNVRIFDDPDDYTSYTESCTSNRIWQIARMLCDKRWGYGFDYTRLALDSWIDAAEWAEEFVRFTDTFGNTWDHVRAASNVDLNGRKVQEQIDDMCLAGRLSRPFIFNGKVHIVPLKALTEDELAACPVFTDEGDSPNVVFEEPDEGVFKSTLKIGRKSGLDLINRVECTFDNSANDYLETPLAPVEDIDAQIAAGRVIGDHALKRNIKKYSLLGVTNEPQALKAAWSILDLGPFDEGGLQNNVKITFKCWFADALELHPHKVIKFENTARLARYGFDYFRIAADGIKRDNDLTYEITAWAYNADYMDAFETTPGGGGGGGGTDPDPGGGDDPPPCILKFGDVTHVDGLMRVEIDPC